MAAKRMQGAVVAEPAQRRPSIVPRDAAEGARESGRGPEHELERNPGTPLDLSLVRAVRVNRSAVERRAATLPARRTVKKQWQAAWLLRAITLIDLTTLAGDEIGRASCRERV